MRTVGRRLSPARARRRARLVRAARQLASKGGYSAVTIDAVCRRAGVARATIYHHFGSKDHLIAEAILEWGGEQQKALRRRPPAEGDPLERVIETVSRVLDGVMREPNLFQAAVMAFVSPDLGVREMQRQLSDLVAGYLEAAFEPGEDRDTERLGMVLSHVFFSSLINMAAGRSTRDQVMSDLEDTARLILGGR